MLIEALLTEKEVSAITKLSVGSVRRLRRLHLGPECLRMGAGQRTVRYTRADVISWLDSHRAGSNDGGSPPPSSASRPHGVNPPGEVSGIAPAPLSSPTLAPPKQTEPDHPRVRLAARGPKRCIVEIDRGRGWEKFTIPTENVEYLLRNPRVLLEGLC
jgi:hypothetical protein